MKQPIDPTAVNHMLAELRLPTITALWPQFTAQADREGCAAPPPAAQAPMGLPGPLPFGRHLRYIPHCRGWIKN